MTKPILDLFPQGRAFVGGAWTAADGGRAVTIRNPATSDVIGTVPLMGAAETDRAIDAAHDALPGWKARSAKERSIVLRRWYDAIMAQQEELAQILTAEQGKPLSEARGEIAYAASFVEWFAEEAKRVYGETIPAPTAGRRITILKEPIGVCAAITPWNFPAAMVTRKVAPALAAGCTIVLKPAPQTPFTALALCALARTAGVPDSVFSVVTGDAVDIGNAMTSNTRVRKLTFTGSTAVGKLLMQQCAGTVKKVSLELGGNAPLIVFDDADLSVAVPAAIACKYRNAGQTCVCANRIYVQDGIYDAFLAAFTEAVAALRVGRGDEDGVNIGPLINDAAIAKVERHLQDATKKGAKIRVGGHRHERGGTFFTPTILEEVTADMVMTSEETFGPVAAVSRFSDEAEVVHTANETPFGLAAYVFTTDLNRAVRVSEALEVGIVGINEGIISNEMAPFGGIKESGIGREGSHYGLDEFLEIKYVCLGGITAA